MWLPEPADPAAYEARIAAAGDVDVFIVASGASDGHVAFNPPGTPLDSGPWIVPLAETTRRDNMATFPDFPSIDAVPTHGVSVGLGTIVRRSRSVRLVIHGDGKRTAAARVLGATGFDPAWPATFIHSCPDASHLARCGRRSRRSRNGAPGRHPGRTSNGGERMSTTGSTRRRLLPLAAGALLLAAGAAPVAAQDVQTSGWESLGDVTLRLAGEKASETTLTALAAQFMEAYPERHGRAGAQGLGQLHGDGAQHRRLQ